MTETVVTPYLNGEVIEDLYMKIPEFIEEILEEIVQSNKKDEKLDKSMKEIIKTSNNWLTELKSGQRKVCKIKWLTPICTSAEQKT